MHEIQLDLLNNYDVDEKDANSYEITRNAMSFLRFTEKEQVEIADVLLAILYIGNLRFRNEPVMTENTEIIDIISKLLLISSKDLESSFISSSSSESSTTSSTTVESFKATQDSLCKLLYSRLFS